MVLKRNTQVGKNNFKLIYLVFLFYFFLVFNSNSKSNLEGVFTDIKILDKISSKNTLLKLENGKLKKFKDLEIKSIKCKNSEFRFGIEFHINPRDFQKIVRKNP